MTTCFAITCDCHPDCGETTIVDEGYTKTDARIVAHGRGWDCDTLPGGTTVDVAPGHRLERAS